MDLNTIVSLPMLANPQETFAMLSFCYAQHPSYLLHIVFPFLGFCRVQIHYDVPKSCHNITIFYIFYLIFFFTM